MLAKLNSAMDEAVFLGSLVLFEGELEKEGLVRKNWKRRWVELRKFPQGGRDGYGLVYRPKKGEKALNMLTLDPNSRVGRPPKGEKRFLRIECVFCLFTPQRRLVSHILERI